MAMINDSDIQALITPEVRNEVIEDVIRESSVLRHFTRLPDMSTSQRELRILDTLPMTYWVDGNDGWKQTTKTGWEKKTIIAQELATIVPISINNLRDSATDVWGTIRRTVVQDMHKKIDQAIITGVDKPGEYRSSLIDSIINAGASIPGTGNFYNDTDSAMSTVEQSGFIPNAVLGGVGMRSDLRRVVDSNGQPIYAGWLDGLEKIFVDNSAWNPNLAKYIIGDLSKCVYAMRQDLEFQIFTEGVITDPVTKQIVYNLMQQDMIAARCTMRLGWEIPNPVNILESDPAKRFPLAMIEASAPVTTYPVNFTVTDGTNPIENATVKLGSLVRKTDSAGKATFNVQGNQTLNYAVKSEGKSDIKGKAKVGTTAVNAAITMN
jgi:HK97 family phage major capsid protein